MAIKQLPDEWTELFRLLHAQRVRYLVVGGWAVGVHLQPRVTADLDLWVAIGPKDLQKLTAALREFGVPLVEPEFFKAGNIVAMGRPPLRIELLPDLLGVEFEKCWRQKKTLKIAKLPIHVISRRDLLASKLAANRPKDQGDIAELQKPAKRKKAKR